jgi:hypothetical protein
MQMVSERRGFALHYMLQHRTAVHSRWAVVDDAAGPDALEFLAPEIAAGPNRLLFRIVVCRSWMRYPLPAPPPCSHHLLEQQLKAALKARRNPQLFHRPGLRQLIRETILLIRCSKLNEPGLLAEYLKAKAV